MLTPRNEIAASFSRARASDKDLAELMNLLWARSTHPVICVDSTIGDDQEGVTRSLSCCSYRTHAWNREAASVAGAEWCEYPLYPPLECVKITGSSASSALTR
jgi:hypothetical protein